MLDFVYVSNFNCSLLGFCFWLVHGNDVINLPFWNSYGQIAGDCSAGFYCQSGSDDYTPSGPTPSFTCPPDTVCAGLCPSGSYCPEGTPVPIPCPEDTYRLADGARQEADCIPCPAGFVCSEGWYSLAFTPPVIDWAATWRIIGRGCYSTYLPSHWCCFYPPNHVGG